MAEELRRIMDANADPEAVFLCSVPLGGIGAIVGASNGSIRDKKAAIMGSIFQVVFFVVVIWIL